MHLNLSVLLKEKINKSDYPVVLLLLVSTVVFMLLAKLSMGSYGGADSYMHYFFAKYAFTYPKNLLDHWGKPLFTLLASPWAQMGFWGIRLFNITCAISSALISYLISKKLELKSAIIAPTLTLFATLGLPVYLSGLTEPLFAFLLIFSIYLWVREKFILSAVAISYIVLVRTEGFLFLPLFFIGLLLLKQYKAIPFLIFGVFLYSLLGHLYLDDFFWLISGSPYGSEPIYGNGDILHFWNYRKETFGTLYVILFFVGLITIFVKLLKGYLNLKAIINWGLIVGCFVGYFAAHSVVWMLGTGSSAGLTRVMIGIVPLGALVATQSVEILNSIPKLNTKKYLISILISVVFIALQIVELGKAGGHISIPTKWGVEEQVLQEAVNKIQNEGLSNRFVIYYNPIVAYMLDLDPFSEIDSKEKIYNKHYPEQDLSKGSLIVYDNHFGPGEGDFPEVKLSENQHFKLIFQQYTQEQHFGSDGDRYHVSVYEKID